MDVDSFTKQFTAEKVSDVLQIGKGFYKVDAEQAKLIHEVKQSSGKEPKHAGIFLGRNEGKRFKPSIALLDIIAETSDRKLVVDDKAEWLFLCGRDIFGSSILRSAVEKGIVLVMNQKDELLGYGKITDDISNLNRAVVKNVLDRGDFLRRER